MKTTSSIIFLLISMFNAITCFVITNYENHLEFLEITYCQAIMGFLISMLCLIVCLIEIKKLDINL